MNERKKEREREGKDEKKRRRRPKRVEEQRTSALQETPLKSFYDSENPRECESATAKSSCKNFD